MKHSIVCVSLAIMTASFCNAASEEKVTSGLAQVYQLKATVKTMTAAKAKLSPSKNPFIYETGTVIYRKPTTVTWHGFIWGCDCETLLGKWEVLPTNPDSVSGAVIWTAASPYNIILLDDMRWHVLGAVDKKGNRCEAAWTIGESGDDSKAFLSFAGFGTLTLHHEEGEIYCTSYIKSLSGTIAGWMPAPAYLVKGKAALCTFCGIVSAGSEDSYETAESWEFCTCASMGDDQFTAVSGTWSLKYNSSLSKKLASENTPTITSAYTKFPTSVKKAIEQKIADVKADAEDVE